jgi:predicted component of viral defense system (DUF524 family)
MRKLSELYETWSVMVMAKVVLTLLTRAGYRVISSNGFFEVDENQFQVEVDRDASIELVKGNNKILIRYEPIYPPAATRSQGLVSIAQQQRTPDMSIELWQGDEAVAVIIFDAKYKTETVVQQQTYLEEDLDKMRNYMQTVRWKSANPRQRPRQVVASAYILYPGDVLQHDADFPETGALPFVPGMPQAREVHYAIKNIFRYANL